MPQKGAAGRRAQTAWVGAHSSRLHGVCGEYLSVATIPSLAERRINRQNAQRLSLSANEELVYAFYGVGKITSAL
jgi:hypothetical protein